MSRRGSKAIPTQNLEAWQAYQIGRQRMATPHQRRRSAEAEGHFRKAIALDPRFALAWAGLADTLALQIDYGGRATDAVLDEADTAAARALELDPDLAEAWASAGLIAMNRPELERAEQMLRRAIALNPNYAPAHHWLSFTLSDLGRRDEALTAAERAVVLDPRSAIINTWLGVVRATVGRFDDALVALMQAIEIDPTMAAPYQLSARYMRTVSGASTLRYPGTKKRRAWIRAIPNALCDLAVAYWDLGDDAEAERWLDRTLTIGEGTRWTELHRGPTFTSTVATRRRRAGTRKGGRAGP